MQITKKLTAVEASEQHASKFLRIFSALHHRNFRLFWSGQLVSLIGTWMQSTAQAWLVLQLTKSAWILGIVGALQFLPIMLFSLFGGILADVLPKRKLLLFTQTSALLQAAILGTLVLTGTVQLWHLFVLATLLGITNAFDMPTRQSFVVELVGRKDLPNAIALNSSVFNMARIIGPGIAGLLIAWVGVASLFLLNALSFIPVIWGLTLIHEKELHAQARSTRKDEVAHHSLVEHLREGFTYIARTPVILLTIAVVGIISLFGINFNITLPLIATEVLNVGPQGFGLISSAFGFGAFVSAVWLAWKSKKPRVSSMLLAAIGFCVLLMLFATSRWYILSIVLIAGVGFAQIAFSAVANTTLQTVTPDYLRGRIMSIYMLVFAGSVPLGNLITGGLSNAFGIATAILLCGGISLIAAFTGWLLRASAEKDLALSTNKQR